MRGGGGGVADMPIFIDCEAREIMHLVVSVYPCVCLFVCALTAELSVCPSNKIFKSNQIKSNQNNTKKHDQHFLVHLKCIWSFWRCFSMAFT